jgi:hypothetical protein
MDGKSEKERKKEERSRFEKNKNIRLPFLNPAVWKRTNHHP